MKISASAPLLLLAFIAQSATSPLPRSCPVVRLPNGRVRARARGRIIRFSCYDGFILVGNKYSTCIRGQWDTPTPICVNAECQPPPTSPHALMAPKYNGAIIQYFCEPGYALIGSAEIYCDGRQWNGTPPHCRDTTAETPIQCDFEKPDLCWWEQDPKHDFDWRRHNFETPSSHIGTGPTHDHTLGPENDGYYLYIEASGRLGNDTARIISPIYKASYTEAGCFSFWYHMYGAAMGILNIYFKLEMENTSRLMFTKEGNQGNKWLHGTFNLPRSEKNFQIIIEGIRGSSYVSDIAIDDVAILQGDKCQNTSKSENETVTTEGYDDQVEHVNAQQSCRGRCKNAVTFNVTTSPLPPLSDTCLCTIDCAEHSICCPDYAEYCVLAFTEEQTTEAVDATTAIRDAVSVLPAKKGNNVTDIATIRPADGKGISIYPKDEIDPITVRPWTTTSLSPITNSTGPKTEGPLNTTRRPITIVPTVKSTPQPKETPFLGTTSATRGHVPLDEQSDIHDPNARHGDSEKVHRGASTAKFSMPGIIGAVVGILTGVTITLMVAIIIVRRRKTYKRGTNGSALSEDSDVRFLTSDEILDFTLARPSENDDT